MFSKSPTFFICKNSFPHSSVCGGTLVNVKNRTDITIYECPRLQLGKSDNELKENDE